MAAEVDLFEILQCLGGLAEIINKKTNTYKRYLKETNYDSQELARRIFKLMRDVEKNFECLRINIKDIHPNLVFEDNLNNTSDQTIICEAEVQTNLTENENESSVINEPIRELEENEFAPQKRRYGVIRDDDQISHKKGNKQGLSESNSNGTTDHSSEEIFQKDPTPIKRRFHRIKKTGVLNDTDSSEDDVNRNFENRRKYGVIKDVSDSEGDNNSKKDSIEGEESTAEEAYIELSQILASSPSPILSSSQPTENNSVCDSDGSEIFSQSTQIYNESIDGGNLSVWKEDSCAKTNHDDGESTIVVSSDMIRNMWNRDRDELYDLLPELSQPVLRSDEDDTQMTNVVNCTDSQVEATQAWTLGDKDITLKEEDATSTADTLSIHDYLDVTLTEVKDEELVDTQTVKKPVGKVSPQPSSSSSTEDAAWNRSINRLCNLKDLEKRKETVKSVENPSTNGMKNSTAIDDVSTTKTDVKMSENDQLEENDIFTMTTSKANEYLAEIISERLSSSIECETDDENENVPERKSSSSVARVASLSDKNNWRRASILKFKIEMDENRKRNNKEKKDKGSRRFDKVKPFNILEDKSFSQDSGEWVEISSDEEGSNDEEYYDTVKKEHIEIDDNSTTDSTSSNDQGPDTNYQAENNEAVPITPIDKESETTAIIQDNKDDVSEKDTDSIISENTKMRKRRPVLTLEELTEATRRAEEEEEQRSRRRQQKKDFLESQVEVGDQLILDTRKNGVKIIVDGALSKKLYPHQRDGVIFMYQSCFDESERSKKSYGCILAHSMGLGKTFQVATLLHTLFSYECLDTKHVLVVCPPTTIYQWAKEIEMMLKLAVSRLIIPVYTICGGENITSRSVKITKWREKSGILMIGYEAFCGTIFKDSVDSDVGQKLKEALLNPGPDLVVCDEGHKIKNTKTQAHNAMAQIRTKRRIILTGTPLQNNLIEYYTMVNFVDPGKLGTLKEFKKRFSTPISQGQFEDSNKEEIKKMKNRAHVLNKLLKNTIQRYESRELRKYLKPIKNYTLFLQMSQLQATMYAELVQKVVPFLKSEGDKSNIAFFGQIDVAKLICSHPLSLRPRKSVEPSEDNQEWWRKYLDENATSIEIGTKIKLVLGIIEETEKMGDKILIFSSSLAELDCVEYFLQNVGTPNCRSWQKTKDYFRMDGSVNTSKREKICNYFNNPLNKRVRVLLSTFKVGGLGLTLTAANRVILLGSTFNPVHDTQSVYRSYRFGQEKEVYVYRLISKGTVEEQIYNRCVSKLALSRRVVDCYQIGRHYKLDEITKLFVNEVDLTKTRPQPKLPEDQVLAKLLLKYDFLYEYQDHERLLENRPEDELDEEDKENAWEEFRKECEDTPKAAHQGTVVNSRRTSTYDQNIVDNIVANLNNDLSFDKFVLEAKRKCQEVINKQAINSNDRIDTARPVSSLSSVVRATDEINASTTNENGTTLNREKSNEVNNHDTDDIQNRNIELDSSSSSLCKFEALSFGPPRQYHKHNVFIRRKVPKDHAYHRLKEKTKSSAQQRRNSTASTQSFNDGSTFDNETPSCSGAQTEPNPCPIMLKRKSISDPKPPPCDPNKKRRRISII